MPNILMASGGRVAHGKLGAEDSFKAQIDAGFTVYTQLNNTYFSVQLKDDGNFRYIPLTEAPDFTSDNV